MNKWNKWTRTNEQTDMNQTNKMARVYDFATSKHSFYCDIYVDLFLSFAFNYTEMTLVAFS